MVAVKYREITSRRAWTTLIDTGVKGFDGEKKDCQRVSGSRPAANNRDDTTANDNGNSFALAA